MNTTYSGIGKRKTSVAKVFLKEGSGKISVNKKDFVDYFNTLDEERDLLKSPFILVNLNNQYDIKISVKGGGINSQVEACCLALSKAICTISGDYRPILGQNGLLRRDSRIKERRKYGLKKARKASQYSKR
jgi:small subunit ribosomal protein S9